MNTLEHAESRTAAKTFRASALTAALALAAFGSQAADAQEVDPSFGTEPSGLYGGLGYEYFDVDGDSPMGDTDIDAIRLRLGYQTTPFLSFEGDALFGLSHGDFDFAGGEGDVLPGVADEVAGNSTGRFELDYLIGAYARGSLPVSDSFNLSARVGWAFAGFNTDGAITDLTTIDVDGSDNGVSYGVGASYDINEAIGLRADYTRTHFDNLDSNGYGISLSYKYY